MSELAKLISTVEEHTVDDHIGRHGWEVVAKKLLKWLRYFMARCDLWKRRAKKWREKSFEWQSAYTKSSGEETRLSGEWAKAETIATRRKELLRRVEWIPDANGIKKYDWCPICNNLRGTGHADDCKLAEELKDAKPD